MLTKTRKKYDVLYKIINEWENITIDRIQIQRVIKEYCEQLYANQVDNIKEMDKFPETQQSSTESWRKGQSEQTNY